METTLYALGTLILYIILGFRLVRENEIAVKVFLGKPQRIKRSGLRFVLWPLEWLTKFSLGIQELEYPDLIEVVTKKGSYNGENFGPAVLELQATLYFRWLQDDDLLETVRVIGDPNDKPALRDLFQETFFDAVRSAGGSRVWKDLTENQKDYADKVAEVLKNEPQDPVRLARLTDLRVVITKLKIPDDLKVSLTAEEAKARQGRGEKERLRLEGEGQAEARKAIFKVNKEMGMENEALLTLREMAKGTSNTIFFGMPEPLAALMNRILAPLTPKKGGTK